MDQAVDSADPKPQVFLRQGLWVKILKSPGHFGRRLQETSRSYKKLGSWGF